MSQPMQLTIDGREVALEPTPAPAGVGEAERLFASPPAMRGSLALPTDTTREDPK